MTTREGLQIYNAHPCGCYDVETKTGGLLGHLCGIWGNWMWNGIKDKCSSITPHVCFKVEAHN